MTVDGPLLLGELRGIAGQDASMPALRAVLFLFCSAGALAWTRRRPLLAFGLFSAAGLLGLGYWLLQLVAPLGLGADPALGRDWAQAGVNAFAEPRGSGFVWGTDPPLSLVSALAAAGVPFSLVVVTPQLAAFLGLLLVVLLPFAFLKNRATAAFAASLAVGGGLWPGIALYGSLLQRPLALVVVCGVVAILLSLAPRRNLRRAFARSRFRTGAALILAAAVGRAWWGGREPTATAAIFVCAATIILASPLRVAIRRAVSNLAMARRIEAMSLLCVFGGSGLFWWDPPRSVPCFDEARNDNAALQRPMDWIRRNVPAGSVVLASPTYSAQIAALAGRRVLFPPSADGGTEALLREPFRRARLYESTRLGAPLARLAAGLSVTHLFLGPGEPSPPAAAPEAPDDEPRLKLDLVYQDVEDFRVFRLARK